MISLLAGVVIFYSSQSTPQPFLDPTVLDRKRARQAEMKVNEI